MHRFVFIVLALGMPISFVRLDQQTSTGNKAVRAGETVTFSIKLDTAPNFSGGQLAVQIGPRDSSAEALLRAAMKGANEGQTEFSVSLPIPLGGPAGVWHVENLTFTLPNGEARPLKFKDVDFTVLPRTSLTVPNSASLQIE